MKTHRITLPAEWHALALRGVSRLLLPMRKQPPLLGDNGGAFREVVSTESGFDFRFHLDTPRYLPCPYRAGDRLALLEPFLVCPSFLATSGSVAYYKFDYQPDDARAKLFTWQPASRMPLAACRCFYRVVSVEPVRISDISEEHARELIPTPQGALPVIPLEIAQIWASERGRSGGDWAWSVRVEREA